MSFEPIYGPNSRALILGSWPSPKSWEEGFYYGHPRNRFWPLMAQLTQQEIPQDIPQKQQLILQNGLALWDVLQSCTIQGAQDASIKDPVPVEIQRVIANAPIQAIFCNGAMAHQLYQRYLQPVTGIKAIKLPSTSPANAAFSLQRLADCWQPALAPWLP